MKPRIIRVTDGTYVVLCSKEEAATIGRLLDAAISEACDATQPARPLSEQWPFNIPMEGNPLDDM